MALRGFLDLAAFRSCHSFDLALGQYEVAHFGQLVATETLNHEGVPLGNGSPG